MHMFDKRMLAAHRDGVADGQFVTTDRAMSTSSLSLGGDWIVESDFVRPDSETGESMWDARIQVTDGAADLAARSTRGSDVQVRVTLDGAPVPEELRGPHIEIADDGSTFVLVGPFATCGLLRNGDDRRHELRLHTDDPDIALYTFTFGA